MIDIIRGSAAFVFAFSFAIFIHEFGHFIFAKLFGVYVETFSIGFGKKLWKRKWGQTEYTISALPFGGYVKMRGMHSKELEAIIHEDGAKKTGDLNPPETLPSTEPAKETLSESVIEEIDALRDKPYWQKFLIFSAGCINNFLTGTAVFIMLLFFGFMGAPPEKAVFDLSNYISPELVLLHAGDQITMVDGKPINNMDEFRDEFDKFARLKALPKVPISFLREGTTQSAELPLQADPDFPKKNDKIVKVGDTKTNNVLATMKAAVKWLDKSETVTVTFERDGASTEAMVKPVAALGPHWIDIPSVFVTVSPAYIAGVLPNLPAEKAGLKAGDIIVSINGLPINTAARASKALRALLNTRAEILVKRGDDITTIGIDVRPDPENPHRGQIGVFFGSPPTEQIKMGALTAVKKGFKASWGMARAYVEGLGELVHSNMQKIRENVGGPIQIANMFYSSANRSFFDFINLFAFFNIILAITNLLPLPVLDGGHILFSTIEFIIRRPLPAKWLLGIYNIFIFLIIGLAVLITFNDVIMNYWRLF